MISVLWLVILVIIIVKISDSKNKRDKKPVPPGTRQDRPPGTKRQPEHRQADNQQKSRQHVSQEKLKRRLQEKYGSQTNPAAFDRNTRTGKAGMNPAAFDENIRTDRSDILTRASRNVAETEEDMLQIPEENGLMEMVSDIMAKGIDTSIPFERDFIAEGMDIINRMTL